MKEVVWLYLKDERIIKRWFGIIQQDCIPKEGEIFQFAKEQYEIIQIKTNKIITIILEKYIE
jgi:hypothetical protein